jgi:hypothetical protein
MWSRLAGRIVPPEFGWTVEVDLSHPTRRTALYGTVKATPLGEIVATTRRGVYTYHLDERPAMMAVVAAVARRAELEGWAVHVREHVAGWRRAAGRGEWESAAAEIGRDADPRVIRAVELENTGRPERRAAVVRSRAVLAVQLARARRAWTRRVMVAQ